MTMYEQFFDLGSGGKQEISNWKRVARENGYKVEQMKQGYLFGVVIIRVLIHSTNKSKGQLYSRGNMNFVILQDNKGRVCEFLETKVR